MQDGVNLLKDSGLLQASDLNVAKIIAYFVFSVIGIAAFVYGKKSQSLRPIIIGIILMGYPYFFSKTIIIYTIGILLTAFLYFWRE